MNMPGRDADSCASEKARKMMRLVPSGLWRAPPEESSASFHVQPQVWRHSLRTTSQGVQVQTGQACHCVSRVQCSRVPDEPLSGGFWALFFACSVRIRCQWRPVVCSRTCGDTHWRIHRAVWQGHRLSSDGAPTPWHGLHMSSARVWSPSCILSPSGQIEPCVSLSVKHVYDRREYENIGVYHLNAIV